MSNATDMLAAYQKAELQLLKGQTVKFGDRQWTLANLPEVQAGRREWERRVASETAAASGQRAGVSLADFRTDCDPYRRGADW
jgi:hypothetical protein